MSVSKTMLAFLAAEKEAHGAPSIEEVSKHLGISRTAARDQLLICVEHGLLAYTPGQIRGFRFTEAGLRTVL